MVRQQRRATVWICSVLVCAGMAYDSVAQSYLDRIVVSGGSVVLQWPAAIVAPPGDANRLFLLESRYGQMRALDLNTGTLLSTPVLTITDLPDPIFSEQGLLGLAFDPGFAENGYFYINYTAANDDTHIERYQMLGDPLTSNVADLSSKHTILTIEQPGQAHNAGWMAFGQNDGYLYVTTGDGGGANDSGDGHNPDIGNAQDTTNLLGNVLRIDVHGDDFPSDAGRNYAIPPTNPFVGEVGADEIWSYGLRNPWRASFDRETGDLWIGDVGQASREEIDFQPASSNGGENYGWRLREGDIETPTGDVGGPPPPGYVAPVYDYPHSGEDAEFSGQAVVGGYVYRGPIAEFVGHYIFADHQSGNVWKLDPDSVDWRASVVNINSRVVPNAGTLDLISSIGEDAVGNLYFTRLFGPSAVYQLATTSQEAVWQGSDNATWDDAENWERDDNPGTEPVAGDAVVFDPVASQLTLQLGQERDVSAASFLASVTLEGGTLRVRSGNVAVGDGATATIASELLAESNAQSIRKLGPGTLLVQGHAGQISVKEGTLGGNGQIDHLTVREGATVAPGTSIGGLDVDGLLKMESGSTLQIELGGTEPTTQYDVLSVGDSATLAGALQVQLQGIFQPSLDDEFTILTTGNGIIDEFDSLLLPELSGNLSWQVSYELNSVSLAVVLPGDFDKSGAIENADLTLLLNNWAEPVPPSPAGWVGAPLTSPAIDNDELTALLNNWGQSAGGGSATGHIPEPTSLVLMLVSITAQILVSSHHQRLGERGSRTS